MDPIVGLETFLLIIYLVALVVMIFSEGLTEILATVILLFIAIVLCALDISAGDSFSSALWGFNSGVQLMALVYYIIRYNN
ncbi:MAG: hypothetical protein WCY37_02110 [Candidatus Dojkabacteria bacterium]